MHVPDDVVRSIHCRLQLVIQLIGHLRVTARFIHCKAQIIIHIIWYKIRSTVCWWNSPGLLCKVFFIKKVTKWIQSFLRKKNLAGGKKCNIALVEMHYLLTPSKHNRIKLYLIRGKYNINNYKHHYYMMCACFWVGVALTGGGRGPRGQPVSLWLLLEHQLAARLDAEIFLGFGDVTHRAGASGQRSLPLRLALSRTRHAEQPRKLLQEELRDDNIILYIK